ncbi:MAG: Tfp pilus assembly protein FimT/FimU [Parahaliea sp.]
MHGFTLLELLVALFVIVLLTSLATLNVGSGGADQRLQAQLQQLQSVVQYAADEAQMSGRDYGLLLQLVDVEGESVVRYGWRERRPEGWREVDSVNTVFSDQNFPSEVNVILQLDDDIDAPLTVIDDPVAAAPQVITYASGEVVAGALAIQRRSDNSLLWRLQWDLLGRSQLLVRGETASEDE